MSQPPAQSPWAVPIPAVSEEWAFHRLWAGFMTARVSIAFVLALALAGLYTLGQPGTLSNWLVVLCFTYLGAALAVRLFARPVSAGTVFDPQWVSTIGVDLLAFSALQFLQAGGLNFSPLFTLPVLTAAVLGSTLLALGTAAAVALLMLTDAWVLSLQQPTEYAQRFLQAGLTGTGFFLMAMLANQLASRLAREERAARRSLLAARTQAHVNELVIETLAEGVLVLDPDGIAHAANPAAWELLGWQRDLMPLPVHLGADEAWGPLADMALRTFAQGPQVGEVALTLPGGERRKLHVRTRLTPAHDRSSASLCVMFLQDLRELEARLRTEKLAAMGRMSTAVAHEIRNPLAAIAQANELLSEELSEPTQRQLSAMVRQNAQRLSRIVEDILDLARVQQQRPAADWLHLDEAVCTVCDEWGQRAKVEHRMQMLLQADGARVAFEADHLRRVLVNLLDNALRHAGGHPDSIRVTTQWQAGEVRLGVFSDGPPIEQGVQRHLFEPFFSSESRSSGLGLYICRELCERHGASIGYRRVPAGTSREGNEFFVRFRAQLPVGGRAPFDTMTA